MQKVLITGVCGLIGGEAYARLSALADRYEVFGLDRSHRPSARVSTVRVQAFPPGRFVEVDLTDFQAVRDACAGMDAVVHLAADPDPDAAWPRLLDSNIIGTYHVFEACRQAGVRRVVYASSGQAILGYRKVSPFGDVAEGRWSAPGEAPKVTHDMPTRPINVYGCTKVWGEALARVYAESHGLSCLCVRFGWVLADDALPFPEGRDVWCSCRDAAQMVERCVAAPASVRFDIFHAFSKSRYQWKDTAHARKVVGFAPQDDVARFEIGE